jgi:uncharacterized membrane protein
MKTGRLEAFSDGVIAIIITIMVLQLKTPHEATFAALREIYPVLLSYVLSFVYVGIYWNNHHHLLHAADKLSGGVLWANLHLLFWLSLVPFVTRWIGETHFAPLPVAIYGLILLFAALAYTILQQTLIACNGRDSTLAAAVGIDLKGKISLATYVIGIALACFAPRLACAIYAIVALIWLLPDTRIERQIEEESPDTPPSSSSSSPS